MADAPSVRHGFLLPAAAVAAGATLWAILLAAAPFFATHAPAASFRFHLADAVYLAAHSLCHQRADRSFHAWGLQLPVCARCLGLYVSAAAGAMAGMFPAGAWKTPRYSLAAEGRVMLGAAVPTVVSVALELAGVWPQSPVIRFVAALPLGAAVGLFVARHAAEVGRALGARGAGSSNRAGGSDRLR